MHCTKSIDIAFCAMPLLVVDRAPGAPALLKAAVSSAGFSSVALDFSIDFFHDQCQENVALYNELGCVFRPNETITVAAQQAADQWIEQSINTIQQINPLIVGISVFTNQQHRASLLLAQTIRQRFPSMKIMMGGLGLDASCNSLSQVQGVRSIELFKDFGQFIKDRQLADWIVKGAALDELITILENTIRPATTKMQYFLEKSLKFSSPIPDWSDYDFDKYAWNNQISLQITGSRGCVRNCTFCDIPDQYGRFQYRQAKDIADEMIACHKKYGVRTFEFTDSLVNGSLKIFQEWMTIIADYNDTLPTKDRIQWFGQYICRPQAQTPNGIYHLMKRSGVVNLVVGMESGSNDVLEQMKKKMTVQDAYDELAQLRLHGISATILLLSGFVNETWDMFLDTLEFISRCQSYIADGTITRFSVGPPLFINDKMYLGKMANELELLLDPNLEYNWTSASNPDLDYAERCRRRMIIQLVLDKLNVPINGISTLVISQIELNLEAILNGHKHS